MKRIFAVATLSLGAALTSTTAALADYWIQIEAQPTLTSATEAARSYARGLPNVVGFDIPGKWLAIALGPYASEADADRARRLLRSEGLIPGDSYLTDGSTYRAPFYPVGANLAALTPSAPPAEAPAAPAPNSEAPTAANPYSGEDSGNGIVLPDETLSEARKSERTLDSDARKALQVALKFAGFYTSTIDGAYGPGTRRAMAAWQTANGYEATGVLTTLQRAETLAAYQDVVDSLALAPTVDETAGVEITLPLGLVSFDSYAPPFAKYAAKDGSGVEVLLISQSGDEATLGGLYEIMQTLEIVPTEGPRSRKNKSFSLTGSDQNIVSHTEARLVDGAVKGWTLIWPQGDEARRQMALEAMRASFSPTDAVLPDAYGDGAEQDIDLLAGLEIRRADKAGTGFFVDGKGAVLTSAALVEGCTQLTLDDTYSARVTAQENGLALLTPDAAIAPQAVAAFDSRLPRLQSEIAVSGFAYEGRLGAPSLNYGLMAEHRGLEGEEDILRLTMVTLPGEAGGPVFNGEGAVIGMLAARAESARNLPENVSFAYDMEKIATFLSSNGVAVTAAEAAEKKSDAQLIDLGQSLTTLVSCWK